MAQMPPPGLFHAFRKGALPLARENAEVPELGATRQELRCIRLGVMALVVIFGVAAATAGATLLAPIAVAVVLALILAPVATMLERIGLPSGAAAVVTVAVITSAITIGAFAMAPSFTNWVERTPQLIQSVERKLRPIKQQLAAVESASQKIAQVTNRPAAPPAAVPGSESLVNQFVRTAPETVTKCVFVVFLTVFLLALRKHHTERLILLPRRLRNRVRMARILRDVRSNVSTYLFVLVVINIGVGAVTAGAFWLAGIGDPLLWGIAFGVLNFIPYLGPTAAIIAAAVIGFATFESIIDALTGPIILLVINTIESNLLQPWLLSRRISISPIVIFLTVATFMWMWGALAAIITVPALILLHAISEHVPSMRPIAILIGTEHSAHNHSRASLEPTTPLRRAAA